MNVLLNWYRRHFSDPQVVLLVVILVLAFAVIAIFGDMLAPAIAAIVVAFLLDGPVEWLKRLGLGHIVSVLVAYVAFLALAIIGFFTILPPITAQFTQFFGLLPDMFTRIQDFVMRLPESYPAIFSEEQVEVFLGTLRSELLGAGQRAVEFSVGSIGDFITLVVYLVLVPVMAFFFLKDSDRILSWMANFLPPERPMLDKVWSEVVGRTGDYARGKVYEIFIVGFVAWGVYSLQGLQFSAFLALLTGLSVVIPYIGATLVTIPVAFVAFFQWGFGSDFMVAVILYIILQALDGNLLVPLLFSEVVKLHPNAIIVSILIFGGIWGLWGVFFAIPLATLIHAVILAWTEQSRERAATG